MNGGRFHRTRGPSSCARMASMAFELDTHPGLGQADGGLKAGTYLEIGAAPGWADAPVAITFPIKVGVEPAPLLRAGGRGSPVRISQSRREARPYPLGGTTSYGAWNVHGGVEFLSLGDTPEAFNAGDQSELVGSVGIGFFMLSAVGERIPGWSIH